uniref:Uncharacterized protein n=1 Tax=Piscinibacter gummiphilus TaxID=946333 RepID=A0ABZ0CR72_9BURK|nr:hypothetical protein [Piscinibacter gummiphilus]WOB07488.1 hypothetical protein RXV79_21570 [Piscinibacter gummiphilus]
MPRISANKLGEYLVTTSPTRRRRIILDQKQPSQAVVPLYRLADEPLAAFFAGGGDQTELDRAVVRLKSDTSGTTWAIDDRRRTAEALEAILGLAHKLPKDGIAYTPGQEHPPQLQIKGLNISVAPHFLLRFEHRGVPCVGALKFHYPKSADLALEQKGGEYVATLLHQWLTLHGPRNHKPMPSHCLSIDVFRGAVVAAPNASTRRMADIAAACEEIAAHWQQL